MATRWQKVNNPEVGVAQGTELIDEIMTQFSRLHKFLRAEFFHQSLLHKGDCQVNYILPVPNECFHST